MFQFLIINNFNTIKKRTGYSIKYVLCHCTEMTWVKWIIKIVAYILILGPKFRKDVDVFNYKEK